jgi:ribosomal-protein-alanine N-acetyltransferase
MPWSENAIRYELKNPLSLWLVAAENGRVLGYVGSQTVIDEADVMNLAVCEDCRNKGVATLLMEQLTNLLKEKGVMRLTLEVRASNEAAINLYNKIGFHQVGRRPKYYRLPTEDALILRKEWDA